ncbi:methyl-accepting chemotaxis protein, partial [Pantoea agglomerans]
KYQTVLDMRGGVRDMAIAVRNLALLTDPAAMKPEWERLQKQRALYISNREALSGMMQTDSGQAGREAMSRIESTEEAALSTLMTAGKLGMDNRQQEVTDYLLK